MAMWMFLASVALVAGSAIWSGFALSVMWGWFIVPTFGLPALDLAPAIGLAMVVGYLTHQYDSSKEATGDHLERLLRPLGFLIARPAIALVMGWVVKQWM
jgi:hypothetical protein